MFDWCETLAFIEELIRIVAANSGKPSYPFGRSSTVNENTWLFSGNNVPSNKTGVPFGLNNGALDFAWIGNELLAAFDLEIWHHTGNETNLTLLTTVSIPNTDRVATFDKGDFGTVAVPKDVQIATRVVNVVGTSPRNVQVHLTISGTN